MSLRKLGCFFPLLIVAAAIIGGITFKAVKHAFWPAAEVTVALPVGQAVARFQSWVGLSELVYELRIETPSGSVEQKLWEDWGPATWTNVYQTPEDWIVVLGGGGVDQMIDVTKGVRPRLLPQSEKRRTVDTEWQYLGRVVFGQAFYAPEDAPECIELLGEGSSPYRRHFQVRHFCPKLSHQTKRSRGRH